LSINTRRLALPRRKAGRSPVVIVFNEQLDPALAKAAIAIEKHPFTLHSAPFEAISARRPSHLYLLRKMPVYIILN